MSKQTARLNDRTFGTCYHPSHPPLRIGGKIITASSNIFVNGRQLARHGDLVESDCGHISEIITASFVNRDNTKPGTARITDRVGNGPYIAEIITGSGDTFQKGS
jgi:hypothetical protein